MIHHVKKSLRAAHPDWSEDKITGVAIATGWKAHNKGEIEESTGNPLDRIVKLIVSKNIHDPQKIEYLSSNLYKHQIGNDPDPSELAAAIEKYTNNIKEGSYKIVSPHAYTVTDENEARDIQTEPEVNESDDKWIQTAINPAHKGYCTPMTKPTCTPARKALAKRFKKGDIHQNNVDETAYKIQGSAAKTFDDSPQLPDAINNPKNA